ncbi:hypothetical protein U9M48_011596 [Paspalum notatum var. saurae]|uniref:Uncharacterized protein n=1 Tax=Paspalum notatum var. saurae TaxID=547442 RepID=A0AAQ3SW56_PASNO
MAGAPPRLAAARPARLTPLDQPVPVLARPLSSTGNGQCPSPRSVPAEPADLARSPSTRWSRRDSSIPLFEHDNGGRLLNKFEIAKDLVEYGFTPDYETWTFHGEKETRVEVEREADDNSASVDRMDEMLKALQPEFGLNSEDPSTKEVEEFFKLLKDSEEPLHEHTKVSVLAFVTRLIAIKSKYFFSNNCFNDLLQLIRDVVPQPNKLPKDMHHCKRLTKSLGMGYEKLDMCTDGCMIFWGDHKDEKMCLNCGKGTYVEVVNEDGEKVTTDVAHKQLRSFPLAPRFKRLLLSHKTAEAMRGEKDAFRKDTVCYEEPPKRLSGQEIADQLASLKLNEEKTAYEGFGKEHNWTHISGIWDLPYAKALKLPHNIDVMHQERNVAESVISMCMDFSDKTKDNVKARKDLAKICNRPTLELTASGGKPRAPFCLKPQERKEVLKWMKN